MIFEKVNFNEEAVRGMKKEKFIEMHIGVLWKDKSEEVRRRMLEQVYELTAKKPARGRKRKS